MRRDCPAEIHDYGGDYSCVSSTVRIVGWILERCDIARFVESRANRQTTPRLSPTKPYDSVVNQRLADVLAVLEPMALQFCSSDEWGAVKAEVLLAGSVEKASESSRHVLALAKARQRQFASRSEAGRYAASIRWQRSNPGGVTTGQQGGAGADQPTKPVDLPPGHLVSNGVMVFTGTSRTVDYHLRSGGGGSPLMATSVGEPSASDLRPFLGKVQSHKGGRFRDVSENEQGRGLMINQDNTFAFKVPAGQQVNARGELPPDRRGLRESVDRLFARAQEQFDSDAGTGKTTMIGLATKGTTPLVMVQSNYGTKGIPAGQIAQMQKLYPDVEIYDQGHRKNVAFVVNGQVVGVAMPMTGTLTEASPAVVRQMMETSIAQTAGR